MKKNLWITRTFLALALLGMGHHLSADAISQKGRGFTPLTQEETHHLENHVAKVIEVKPNKIGVDRIHEHLQNHGDFTTRFSAVEPENEFTSLQASTSHASSMLGGNSVLPSSVNNSTLPSFPPIGDQQQLGSCVGWGSTYYHATHEIGLLNGLNNKNSFNNVLSPKWTYNLLNGGSDNGLSPLDAYNLLFANGAVSIVKFPYDSNYTQWDLNTQDWISAISNRMSQYSLIPGLGGSSSQNLTAIKNTLNNGHVVTFATYIDSWVFTTLKSDPSNPQSPYVGQYAATWMNGTNGGHFMTIVGYDDNLWIDVNGNGQVDAGERGAFLIANSWSADWGNAGFIWISYDAFNAVSAVPNGPHAGRVPAGDPLNSCVIAMTPKAHNYMPSLIAEFSLTQNLRDQINVQAGASPTSQTMPSLNWAIPALDNQGGPFEFNGTSSNTPESATFAIDLTDLLPTGNQPSNERYYLSISDSTSGHPTVLNSFSLIDFVHNNTINNTQLPKSYDHSSGTVYIDYNFSQNNMGDTTPPVVSITSPANNAAVQGTAQITVNATDNVAVASVQLYIDSVLFATDTTAPYVFSVDTTKLSNGNHQFTAVATDTSNNSSHTAITLNIQNTITPSVIDINAGGPLVSYQGANWLPDTGTFSGHTTTMKSGHHFANSVYQTARYGNMSYHLNVPNGPHLVTLKFAELALPLPHYRVFNVSINGNQVVHNLDIFSHAGFNVPYDLTFPVNVTNNQITIDFAATYGTAQVNGIQISTP